MADSVERKIGKDTVAIDRGLCIGSGNCVKVAPELFELDTEEICAFLEPPPKVDRQRVIEACQVCPVEALVVRDESDEQIVP